MKKIVSYMLVALVALVVASCASKNSSPSAVVKAQIEAAQNKDAEGFVKCMYFKKDNSDKAKEALAAQFNEKLAKAFEQNDGIKSYEILSEEINEEGDKAKVKTSITYGNGVVDESTTNCIKVDEKWYVDSNK